MPPSLAQDPSTMTMSCISKTLVSSKWVSLRKQTTIVGELHVFSSWTAEIYFNNIFNDFLAHNVKTQCFGFCLFIWLFVLFCLYFCFVFAGSLHVYYSFWFGVFMGFLFCKCVCFCLYMFHVLFSRYFLLFCLFLLFLFAFLSY